MVHLATSSAVNGAACLGVALLGYAADPWVVMGVLAVGVVYVGGRLAEWDAVSRRGQLAGAAIFLVGTRVTSGPLAAALVAVLLGTGAVVRVRLDDLRYAFAVVGATIAVCGRAEMATVAMFWLCGLLAAVGWRAAQAALAGARRLTTNRHGRPPSSTSSVT